MHVPTTNLFSYTYPVFLLSITTGYQKEVVFYNLTTVTALLGLFLLFTADSSCGDLSHVMLYEGAPLIFLVLSVIYLRILFERTDIRPELFSFLFLATVVTILYRYKEKFTKLIFLLIPLELLWTNMHIYFPYVILITLLFVIDNLVTHRKNL